jgi:ketosteroid isomerase-like protein
MKQIASSFLQAFADLSGDDHTALRAEDCTHIFAPASLNPPAPKSNQVFADHIVNLRRLLTAFPVTAKEIHTSESNRQITIWANGKPYFRKEVMSEGEEWDYTGEYIFILDLNEEGKIVRIVEFLDSLATERLRGLMVKARKNLDGTDAAAF